MEKLEMFLLLLGFLTLVGYLANRAFIGNRNFLKTGKISWKNEVKAGGRVLLVVLLFLIYTAFIFIIFNWVGTS